jgi:hypothetical protein
LIRKITENPLILISFKEFSLIKELNFPSNVTAVYTGSAI